MKTKITNNIVVQTKHADCFELFYEYVCSMAHIYEIDSKNLKWLLAILMTRANPQTGVVELDEVKSAITDYDGSMFKSSLNTLEKKGLIKKKKENVYVIDKDIFILGVDEKTIMKITYTFEHPEI